MAQNGITPDFVVCIEQFDSSTQLDGVDISNSYLILEPYTNTAMHKMNFKRKISYPSCTSIANLVWTNFAKLMQHLMYQAEQFLIQPCIQQCIWAVKI